MKRILFLLFMSFATTHMLAQDKNQLELLNKFIVAHNTGTEKSISDFINETYNPALLGKIDLKKHIAFYYHIVSEFGPLNKEIYEVVEVKPTKLIVNLIKKEQSISNRAINPTQILMVEIDTELNQPKYLSRGLGLGALACSIKKD